MVPGSQEQPPCDTAQPPPLLTVHTEEVSAINDRKISPRLAATWQTLPAPLAAPLDNNSIIQATVMPVVPANLNNSDVSSKLLQLQELQHGSVIASRSLTLPPSGNRSNISSQQQMASLLREDGRLYYEDLRATPYGRHLLLVTLLEKVDRPLWEPRAQGRIQLYLPLSLRLG